MFLGQRIALAHLLLLLVPVPAAGDNGQGFTRNVAEVHREALWRDHVLEEEDGHCSRNLLQTSVRAAPAGLKLKLPQPSAKVTKVSVESLPLERNGSLLSTGGGKVNVSHGLGRTAEKPFDQPQRLSEDELVQQAAVTWGDPVPDLPGMMERAQSYSMFAGIIGSVLKGLFGWWVVSREDKRSRTHGTREEAFEGEDLEEVSPRSTFGPTSLEGTDAGMGGGRPPSRCDQLSERLKAVFPEPAEDVVVLVCGPPQFVMSLCLPLLRSLEYKNVITF